MQYLKAWNVTELKMQGSICICEMEQKTVFSGIVITCVRDIRNDQIDVTAILALPTGQENLYYNQSMKLKHSSGDLLTDVKKYIIPVTLLKVQQITDHKIFMLKQQLQRLEKLNSDAAIGGTKLN